MMKQAPVALLSALLCAAPVVAAAQPRPGCGAEINYEKADIRAFIDEIALRTGRVFILDPRVEGQVTVKSPPNGGLCPDEAWELFQATLRVHAYVATPVGVNKYRIVPVQDGPRSAGPVGAGVRGDLVTEVVRLRYIDAREAAANLAQIVNERGVVSPQRGGNSLVIVDTADNVVRLKKVLATLDQDTTVYRTIPLANASATDVARMVTQIAKQEAGGEGASVSPVTVVPVEANNSILVRAEPAVLNRLSGVIIELDRLGEQQSDLAVIPLSNTDAEEMAKLLRELQSGQPSAATPDGQAAPAQAGRTTITFHKPTNSLIINGDADTQRRMQSVVAQLDVRQAQVLVEAIIVEVSDNAARELGVQYFLTGLGGSAVPFSTTNFQSSTPNVLSLVGPTLLETDNFPDLGDADSDDSSFSDTLAQAAISSLLGINGFALGGAGQLGENGVFGAVLNAVREDRGSKILSTPSVVTLDNTEAELSVGQEIPITTGEAVGDDFQNAFRQIDRQDVGVILRVTPQINEGGTVTMKIEQETSSVAGQVISTSTDLITNKSRIATTALVDDGAILVVGGLIDDSSETVATKVPGLGNLPGFGNLFRTQTRSRTRRNLMVFLRPTILQDRESSESVTRKKLDFLRLRDFLYSGDPSDDLENLIRDLTGKNGDAAPTENSPRLFEESAARSLSRTPAAPPRPAVAPQNIQGAETPRAAPLNVAAPSEDASVTDAINDNE